MIAPCAAARIGQQQAAGADRVDLDGATHQRDLVAFLAQVRGQKTADGSCADDGYAHVAITHPSDQPLFGVWRLAFALPPGDGPSAERRAPSAERRTPIACRS